MRSTCNLLQVRISWLLCPHVLTAAVLPLLCSCVQVMPVEVVGFMMKPYGFFMWNPTLDVPPERNAASKEELTQPARAVGLAGARSRL